MASLKRVLSNLSALWSNSEKSIQSSPAGAQAKTLEGFNKDGHIDDLFINLNSHNFLEDRRETGEDEFSVDYDLEEFLIKTSAQQEDFRDFNFASIKSANNEYRYLASPLPIDLSEQIYSSMDQSQLLFIDSKRICLANTLKQSIDQLFLKKEIEKISILSHTVAVRRQKLPLQSRGDLMLLDLRRFQDLVPYLQLFYTNLL